MSGRPQHPRLIEDPETIRRLNRLTGTFLGDLFAYVMRSCGCTYSEIGTIFGVTRQAAEYMVKRVGEQLDDFEN